LKKKIRVKGAMNGIVVAFYENNQAFQTEARMTKDKVARSGLRRRLMAWEKKVNIIGNNHGALAAREHRRVVPIIVAYHGSTGVLRLEFSTGAQYGAL
jgi:hypothetical protein